MRVAWEGNHQFNSRVRVWASLAAWFTRTPSVIPAEAGIQEGLGGGSQPWRPSTAPGFPLPRE